MKAENTPSSTADAKNGDVPRRSMFDDDLPDLAELDAAPKKPHRVTDILQIDGLDDIVAAAPLVRPKQPVQPAEPKPSEIDYRVTCRTCGTPLHMKLDRVGKKISCPDCHSSFVVPPPPPGWSPAAKQSPILDDHADVPLAPNEALTPVRLPETQRTVASEYLDKAKQELDDEELESLYDGDFDTSGFMTRTFASSPIQARWAS